MKNDSRVPVILNEINTACNGDLKIVDQKRLEAGIAKGLHQLGQEDNQSLLKEIRQLEQQLIVINQKVRDNLSCLRWKKK
ncbi:hypothetical protein HCJ13_15520 [Listeria booriae]|uniref:Uncharacterized protein n=1 Tax=Listeria booriae TaxID=1552123 RepID=A0A7X0ZZN9_9LIST|nr:hypothetical protein [Listeria booriae]MBC1524297.1 hypothetical protein [Listeria booriae]MBC1651601.1 hypothetical protein [Listeria booriae]MBC2164695.1 hypothetical protein [Listeria booriae]MBC2312532.1 hypothetical protein [Listeria booriae]MDT0112494.1 hypothetical protein [Listeria booriae]